MPYNGYTEQERVAKGKARARLLVGGTIPAHPSDCMLCGDPDVPVEGHSEDYSKPYRWEPPALYWLCRHCHRDKVHKRFFNPKLWRAFLAHVRRGGYARDLKDPSVAREFAQFRRALDAGRPFTLRPLRARDGLADTEWWDGLTLDPASLADPAFRPRA
jgi:hypothetical protein